MTTLEHLRKIYPQMVETRRHIHQHPELSFLEFETSAYIQKQLHEMGIAFSVMATTGIVAHIGSGSRCVALRADIDALPLVEETRLPYSSLNHGVMHACGHDTHTTMLLTAAQILKTQESTLGGVVKLIFQPGEEKTPGGASLMIEEGALNNPKPEIIRDSPLMLHSHTRARTQLWPLRALYNISKRSLQRTAIPFYRAL
ncbi:MAG: amidohydrolase [Candidatus Kapabacteria bacterium]|nr:amidohydrolase [Candidatus Kapabacteria bacterium]